MAFKLSPVAPQEQQPGTTPGFSLSPATPPAVGTQPQGQDTSKQDSLYQDVMDFLSGANTVLAQSAGVPVENIDKLYKTLSGKESLYGPEGMWGAMKSAGKAIGLDLDPSDNFYSHLGGSIANSVVTAGAILAGHPEAAASKAGQAMATVINPATNPIMKAIQSGARTVNDVLASLGGQMIKRPYLSAAQEVGGNIGAVTGQEDAKRYAGGDTTAGNLLSIAEGTLGSMIAGAPFNIARGGLRLPRFGRGDLTQKAQGLENAAPLQTEAPDMSVIGQAVAASKNEVENNINRAVAKFKVGPQGPDPATAAENLQNFVKGPAFKQARSIESNYWRDVNKEVPIDGSELRAFVKQMLLDTPRSTLAESVPQKWLSRINKAGRYVAGVNEDGTPIYKYKPVPLKEYLAIRSVMDEEARTDTSMLPTLRRNMNMLSDEILSTAGRHMPSTAAWEKARDYSTWLNNQFTRGPLARFIQPYGQEANLPNAQPGAESLIRQPRAGRQLAEIRQKLPSPAINKLTQGYVNNAVAEIAQNQGPEAAARYIQQPRVKRFIQMFPKVAQNFQDASDGLLSALKDKQAFQASKFLQLAGQAPEVAAHALLNAPNAGVQARTIMKLIAGNKEAVQAFKDAIIEKLVSATDREGKQVAFNPSATLTKISQQNIKALLENVFTSQELGRFQKILRAGASLENPSAFTNLTGEKISPTLGRMVGSKLGLFVPGRSTLVIQSALAKAGQQFFQRTFNTYPASTMVANAVRDPKWEALLYSKAPLTMKDLQADTKLFKRFAGIAPAATGMFDRMQQLQGDLDNGQ